MKTFFANIRTGILAAFVAVVLSACGNSTPENPPTPIPSPEEKPTHIEGASQPRDTTFVAPKS